MRETTNVTVTIERSKGLFGSATVSWSVFKVSTSVLASDDFIMASGSVDFAENVNEKVGGKRQTCVLKELSGERYTKCTCKSRK